MKKLLFVGHMFHKKTKSCAFMLNILRRQYDVEEYYLDPYQDKKGRILKGLGSGSFDILVCWQVMPDVDSLKGKVHFEKAVFFPMYDGCPAMEQTEKWYPYREFQIICFAKKLYKNLKKNGFNAKYIQYFPQPQEVKNWGDERAVYLWYRRESIGADLTATLMADYPLNRLHIHKAPDPQQNFYEPQVQIAKDITYSTWYDKKSEMYDDIQSCSLYMAPREKEGIGMSFLEAMAMGRCVVAPNEATMNEYIEDGKTGILYDLKKPQKIKLEKIREIQNNAWEAAKVGYDRWQQNQDKILDWLAEKPDYNKKRISIKMLKRFIVRPLKVLKTIL